MPTPPPFVFLLGVAWVLLLAAAGFTSAQEPSATASGEAVPPPAGAPKVEKIGDHTYRLGQIIIDAAEKTVSLPVEVNMREGVLEYVLVGMKGKVHESLLVTKANPMELAVALKLCRFQDGLGDLLDPMLPPEERQGPAGKAKRGSEVSLSVDWQAVDGSKGSSPVHAWITDIKNNKPSPEGLWHYTGSRIIEGHFLAESEGSFIALYLDPNALFNSALSGNDDDERWGTLTEQIPPLGTKATLTIRRLSH